MLSLVCAKPNNMVFVSYVDSADAVATPDGTVYFFTMQIPPGQAGFYLFQESRDAGGSWRDLGIFDYSDLNHPPLVQVSVNPLIRPPYVWYRFVPVSAFEVPFQSGQRNKLWRGHR
jgi:hypothetical protein